MKHTKALVFFILLIGLACTSSDNIKINQFTDVIIDANNYDDCENWSELIKDIDFVPLETNNQSLIDRIRSIQVSENGNYLIKTAKRKVMVFTKTGSLIYNFNRTGKGQNELPYVMDAFLSANDRLYIFDANEKYLLLKSKWTNVQEYMLPNKNCFTLTISPSDWAVDTSFNFYQWYTSGSFVPNDERYSLIITDSSGNVISRNFPYNHYAGGGDHFFQSGSKFLVQPPLLNDTIYQIAEKEIIPAFYIDFGKQKYTSDTYKIEAPDNINNPFHLKEFCLENNVCNSISRPIMSDVFLTFIFSSSTDLLTCIYNKKKKETVLIKCIESKIDNIFTPGLFYASFNNKFITSVDAWKVRRLIAENKTSAPFLTETRRHQLLEKLKDVQENDNPVLMLVTFKD